MRGGSVVPDWLVATEKIAVNIMPMATGTPRLPQAMARKDMKENRVMTMSCSRWRPLRLCTAQKTGRPKMTEGSMARNLPRRGPTTSGGVVAMTPVVASAEA